MRGRAPSFPYNGQNGRTFQGRGCKDPTPLCFFFFAFFFFLPLSRLMQFSKHNEQPLGPMCTSRSASQEFLAPLRAAAVKIVCSLLQKKKKEPHLQDTAMCPAHSKRYQEPEEGSAPRCAHLGSQTERPQAPPPEVSTGDTQSHDYAWCTRRSSMMPSGSRGKTQEHSEGSPNGQ